MQFYYLPGFHPKTGFLRNHPLTLDLPFTSTGLTLTIDVEIKSSKSFT